MEHAHDAAASLSDRTRAIIFGSLLGDGSLRIHTGYREARFSFRHSSIQAEYFYWKATALREISSASSTFRQPGDGYGSTSKLRYQSRALPELTAIYRQTHRGGQLQIRRAWLNELKPLSLAIWWFDDGSLITNTRRGVFCTDGFDRRSVETLAQYLRKVWGIRTHLGAVRRPRGGRQEHYYRLWIRSTEELRKFLRIILPHTPVSNLLPKVLMLYKDPQLQQRWISEVVRLSGFSRAIVERYREEKASRWQRFRA